MSGYADDSVVCTACSTLGSLIQRRVVSDASSSRGDVSCEPSMMVYPTGERTLRGFLGRPAGAGPFPAVVFNHGSEKLPGTMQGQLAVTLQF